MVPVQEPLSAEDAACLEHLLLDNVAGRVAWFMSWLVAVVVEPWGEMECFVHAEGEMHEEKKTDARMSSAQIGLDVFGSCGDHGACHKE